MQLPGEFSPFIEKKVFFLLSGRGITPPHPLSGPTTKKNTFFMCVFPYIQTNPISAFILNGVFVT